MESKGSESPRSREQYLAGVLDSLGCVRIESLRKGERATLCVWVTFKHFPLMEVLQKFGAHIGQKTDGQYRAKWKGQKAYNILKRISPHLSFRKDQARLGIEFHEQQERDLEGKNDQFYRMRLKLLKAQEEGGNTNVIRE